MSALMFGNWALYVAIVRRLKKEHNKVWLDLREPDFFTNNTMKTSRNFKKFVKTKQYFYLQDAKLTILIKMQPIATLLFFAGILIFLILLSQK